jgi:formylglycine-generating enzyme required for sulfatase activity
VDAKRDQEVAARTEAEAARRLEEENQRLLQAKERKRAEEERLRLDQVRRRDLEEQQRIAQETRRRAEEQLRVEVETRRLAEQERLRTEEERRRTETEAQVEKEEPRLAEQAFSLAALEEERVSARGVPNPEEQEETSVDSLDDTLDPDTPVSEEIGTAVVENSPVDFSALVKPVPTEPDPPDEVSSLSSTSQELPETGEGVEYAPFGRSLPAITTKTRTGVIAIVVVLSAFLLIGVFALRGNRGAISSSTPKPPATPVAPAGTVYIPGGEFEMGTNAGDDYEKPAHKVTVNPFFMDIREVTCEDYLKFISATGHKSVAKGANRTCSTGPTQTPATGVDWNDATAYTQWAKKRLPTEEEWEFAARGSDGRRYPWGNEWKGTPANIGSVKSGLVEVGSYPEGKSPAGVMDLIGNAWEWTSTDLKPYPNGQLPRPPRDKDKVIRGGSWKEDKTQATSTYRGFLLASGEKDYSATGIRCVQDVPPQR